MVVVAIACRLGSSRRESSTVVLSEAVVAFVSDAAGGSARRRKTAARVQRSVSSVAAFSSYRVHIVVNLGNDGRSYQAALVIVDGHTGRGISLFFEIELIYTVFLIWQFATAIAGA